MVASGDSKSRMTSGGPDPRVEGIMLQPRKCLRPRKENGLQCHSPLFSALSMPSFTASLYTPPTVLPRHPVNGRRNDRAVLFGDM